MGPAAMVCIEHLHLARTFLQSNQGLALLLVETVLGYHVELVEWLGVFLQGQHIPKLLQLSTTVAEKILSAISILRGTMGVKSSTHLLSKFACSLYSFSARSGKI